ncbi:MAG TPA: UbiA family prenyltransferase, partial [Saprospiraceae bacterium]|nr:UbiA family prenyltransferase [Saprospiraceae bacterium]
AFCGGVSLVLLLPELDSYFQTGSISPENPVRLGFLIIAFYSLFAFLTTFLREVIMDLEDMEGDQADHRRTLPLISGVGNAKIVAVVTGFLIILLCALIWSASSLIGGNIPAIIIFSIFNLLLLLSIYKIFTAEIKQHYGTISTQIKVLMLLGLLFAFTL